MAYAPRFLLVLVWLGLAACSESPQEPNAVTAGMVPQADGVVDGGGGGGIVVPVTGTTEDGGTFKGKLVIVGAGFEPQTGPILSYRIQGALVPRASEEGDGDPREDSAISFPPAGMSYHAMGADDDCVALTLAPPPAFDPATKITVEFDVSVIDTRTLPGPANLIAELICANDRMGAYDWQNAPPPPQ